MASKSDPERQTGERIAKVMARAGLCSRREAEAWISAGRVAVNGATIASPALDVTPDDRVTVDGEPLPRRERTRLFLYHKPRGLVTTARDPEGRPTIFEALPKGLPRLVSVGRLDIASEGLLLLTNDGGLARALELPETGWLRRYRVRAHGHVTQARLDRLAEGITVEGVRYGPIEAALDHAPGANLWLTMGLREGKNREIRNVLGALGLSVNRLIRVGYGPFELGDLPEGAVEEVPTRRLREALGEALIAKAGADFSGALAEGVVPRTQAPRPQRPPRRHDRADWPDAAPPADERPRKRPARHYGDTRVWRGGDAPLRRKFHGARSAPREEDAPAGPKRAGLVADRKGRRVLVERIGEKKPEEPRPPRGRLRDDRRRDGKSGDEKRHDGKRRDFSRDRPPRDRASGPRPKRPRPKR